MAIVRQNLELMSPEEGDSDGARQNKITFFGFKSGDADYHDVTSGVGPTTHQTGSGLNDATFGGVYTGSGTKTYQVKITATGTPDSFKFSSDGGSTFSATNTEVRSDGPQDLSNGVTVVFGATTGHTLNDVWQCVMIEPLTSLTDPVKLAEIEVNHPGTGADQKGRLIIRTNEGGAVGTTTVDTTAGGSPVAGDITSGGTYTGGPTPVTYYVKIEATGTPDTFSWSTDKTHWSAAANITGSAQTLEKGVTATFAATTGHTAGNIYAIAVGGDTLKLHANADMVCTGHVVSENGYVPKILDSSGAQLNSYY